MNGPDQGSVDLIVLSGVLTDGSPWCQRSRSVGSQIEAVRVCLATRGGAACHRRPLPATSVETLVLEFGGLGGPTIAVRRSLAVIGLLDLAVISIAHDRIVPRCGSPGQPDPVGSLKNSAISGLLASLSGSGKAAGTRFRCRSGGGWCRSGAGKPGLDGRVQGRQSRGAAREGNR